MTGVRILLLIALLALLRVSRLRRRCGMSVLRVGVRSAGSGNVTGTVVVAALALTLTLRVLLTWRECKQSAITTGTLHLPGY